MRKAKDPTVQQTYPSHRLRRLRADLRRIIRVVDLSCLLSIQTHRIRPQTHRQLILMRMRPEDVYTEGQHQFTLVCTRIRTH